MILLSLILVMCASAHAAEKELHFFSHYAETLLQKAWAVFKTEHAKIYVSLEEELHRMQIFGEKLGKIESHNFLYQIGLKSYKMGINQFTDMEFSEVIKHKGIKPSSLNHTGDRSTYLQLTGVNLPKVVDWRDNGYVTPVKNQRDCGSCWAFSTTGSLEGQHFRKTGKLVSLSEQNLIDCSAAEGNEGCSGGLMDYAFKYIKTNGGIDTEQSYPYEAKVSNCRYKEEYKGATVSGFVDIEEGNEDMFTNAIATVGPVSVAVNAKESFVSYQGGIYEEPFCDSETLNHGLLAVGYGSENGKNYYILKNSWGPQWGENGYIRFARNKNNMCGIASLASYPLV